MAVTLKRTIFSIVRKISLIIIFTFFWFLFENKLAGQSTIKEEIKTVKTYPFSDPNPIPSIAINSTVSPFYPYFVFDGYTDQGISKDWKVITLENEFINVSVLPEVGGKVY